MMKNHPHSEYKYICTYTIYLCELGEIVQWFHESLEKLGKTQTQFASTNGIFNPVFTMKMTALRECQPQREMIESLKMRVS